MHEHYYAVIMAGGGGTRLWPLSRLHHPKQLLKLGSDLSLFELAIHRLEGVFPPERILVVTSEEQAKELRKQALKIPSENFLIEPQPKGTASVVGLAAIILQKKDPDAVMAVLTADHLINNIDRFHDLIQAAYAFSQEEWLVTIGIKPDAPSTGFGYLQKGEKIADYGDTSAFQVKKFKEKPDLETAIRLVAGGDHYWNSGMFFWRVDAVLDEFKRQMPELSSTLLSIKEIWGDASQSGLFEIQWCAIQPQTIDYGIMEGARKVAMLPVNDLGWSDVGSWDSLFGILEKDKNGNINLGGKSVNLDSQGSLTYSDNDQKMIVTIGTNDIVIIDTGDALLVCPRDQSQRIKEVISILREKDHQSYL